MEWGISEWIINAQRRTLVDEPRRKAGMGKGEAVPSGDKPLASVEAASQVLKRCHTLSRWCAA